MTKGKRVEVACEHCGEPFRALVGERVRGKARFCSKQCAARKRTGSKLVNKLTGSNR